MNILKKKVFANLVSSGFIQFANFFFPLFTLPYVSRIIGPDNFGVINFAITFSSYFILLIGFGFDLTATRRIKLNPQDAYFRNKVFSEVLYSQIILLSFSILVFSLCLYLLPQLNKNKLVAIFAFLSCFSTVFSQSWLFQSMHDLRKIAFLAIIGKVVFTFLIFAQIKNKSDYYWHPLALSVSNILISLISFIWGIYRYKIQLFRFSFIDCIKLLKSEKSYFLTLCAINLYTSTNLIMLGIISGPKSLGYYIAGQKIITIIQSIISVPLTNALFPYLTDCFKVDKSYGISIVQKIIPLISIITFVIGLVLYIYAPNFILLIYGSNFYPSIIVCRVLAFVPLIITLGVILAIHVTINLKLDHLFLRTTFIVGFFSIFSNILMVNYLNELGAAFNWVITEFIALCILIINLKNIQINVLNVQQFRLHNISNTLNQLRKNFF